jgi:AbrB family looped-hinge helix DNA binding protein
MSRTIWATITSKGQTTIPVEVRRRLGVTKGDRIEFVIDDDGKITVQVPRYPTIASLAGIAGTLKHPMTWREVKDIAHEDAVIEKYRGRGIG